MQNLRETMTILPSTKNYKEMNRCNVKPDYIVYLYVLTVMNKLEKKVAYQWNRISASMETNIS